MFSRRTRSPIEIPLGIEAVAQDGWNRDDALILVVGQGDEDVDDAWRLLGKENAADKATEEKHECVACFHEFLPTCFLISKLV